jgi:tRNA modification GTPase
MMANIVNKHFHLGNETVAITRRRHKHALQNALDALDRCENALKDNMSNEFLALDIREAIAALDDITGHTTSEDVLNNIFDQFCVGK